MGTTVAVVIGYVGTLVTLQLPTPDVAQVAAGKPSEFATARAEPFGSVQDTKASARRVASGALTL